MADQLSDTAVEGLAPMPADACVLVDELKVSEDAGERDRLTAQLAEKLGPVQAKLKELDDGGGAARRRKEE